MTFTVTYDGNGATGGSVPVDATAYNSGDQVTVLGNTGNLSLTAQFSFGADFTSHTSHFSSERVQLVHHRVDGVLQLEN